MLSHDRPPISERRTDLAAGADIKRRLLFVFVVLGAPAGAILLLFGLTQHRPVIAVIGGIILPLAVFAWWRRRTSLTATAEEIRGNPFKPNREPEE